MTRHATVPNLFRFMAAVLLLSALAILLDSCSARTRAFRKAGVERHQPKFE